MPVDTWSVTTTVGGARRKAKPAPAPPLPPILKCDRCGKDLSNPPPNTPYARLMRYIGIDAYWCIECADNPPPWEWDLDE